MQISLLARGQNQSLSQVCMLIMDFWELKLRIILLIIAASLVFQKAICIESLIFKELKGH